MNKKLVYSLFEEKVFQFPEHIAVEEENDRKISYQDLHEHSGYLANKLRRLLPGKHSTIGVLMPSSIRMVASVVAIFKVGGIYVPMDFRFSSKILMQLFNQTLNGILIIQKESLEEVLEMLEVYSANIKLLLVLDKDRNLECFNVDEQKNLSSFLPYQNELADYEPLTEPDGEDPNYIFHTSGSTSTPKAILGKHASLSHFIHWEIQEFKLDHNCRVSQLTQPTFDASLRDIFLPLSLGGTLFIPSEDTRTNTVRLIDWLEHYRISVVHCVPTLFRMITKELIDANSVPTRFENLQFLFLSGESLYSKDIQDWRQVVGNHTQLVNFYGPTEATMIKTFHRIEEISENAVYPISVGKPISNTFVAIINGNRICSIGEQGEIYIKTPYLTKGYYNNKPLTDQVFVQNPLLDDREDIVYRTGDIGRYLADRSIELLGRMDQQVKINGVRLELSEIEQAALKIEGVEQVVVNVQVDKSGQQQLICYYTGVPQDEADFKQRLMGEMFSSVQPHFIVHLDKFPVTITGKVDKKALPLPDLLRRSQITYQPPQGETEVQLEKLWKDLLGQEVIGRSTSFFELGGHSLKAIQLATRIYKQFGISLKLGQIFENPTVEALAKAIEAAEDPHSGSSRDAVHQEFEKSETANERGG